MAEDLVRDRMRLHARNAQEIAERPESQHVSHTTSEQVVRGTAYDMTCSKLDSEMKEDSKSKASSKSDMIEPHHQMLSKLKTEPDSDADEELPLFFGMTGSSEPLETEVLVGKPGRNIGTLQMGSEISSVHVEPPASLLLAGSPTVPQTSAVEFSSASSTVHSDVSVKDQERGTKSEHQQRTGELKKHVCDVCQKAFPNLSHLKRHKLFHTGEKNHVCDVCNKAFTVASHLKDHKLTHTGEKSHVCDVCNKAFAQAGNLKVHMLTHTGEKNHVCDVCKKAFSIAGSLRKHELTHKAEKRPPRLWSFLT